MLLDIKSWDEERHRRLTGADIGPVLEAAGKWGETLDIVLTVGQPGTRTYRSQTGRLRAASRRARPPGWC